MATTVAILTIESLTCGNCGIVFGLEASHLRRVIDTHREFFCPNGCKIHYGAESAAERKARELEAQLRVERTRLESARAAVECASRRADTAERRRRAQKGVTTRIRARVKHGVCPVPGCKRHFDNLGRHMASKHPLYEPSAEPETINA